MRLFYTIFSLLMFSVVQAQEVLPLYGNDPIPGNKPNIPNRETSGMQNGIFVVHRISQPTLAVYLPSKEKANGTAVVICPGGGYGINAAGHEGDSVARVLNAAGIAAFVLKYRIPDDSIMDNKTIRPLQDAQQAMKTVRDNAAKWNIAPKKIGIMGFSAGGHLASTEGTHYQTSLVDNKEGTSLRPDFMILVYPVISFKTGVAHMGSRNNLVGRNAGDDLVNLYSNELQVTEDTPPTFLVHATDDNGVKVSNSLLFYEALLEHKVPAELHVYEKGGHGFGMINKTTKELWMNSCLNWMAANGWIPQQPVIQPR